MPFSNQIHLLSANLARTAVFNLPSSIPVIVSVIPFATTDGTVTRVLTVNFTSDLLARCELQVVAHRTNAIAFSFMTRQLDLRSFIGVAAVTVTTPVADNVGGVITAVITVTAVGSEIRVDVNGAAGQNIDWDVGLREIACA